MQRRRTGDARRSPWALPWQPNGSAADLRWKGRRDKENYVSLQPNQMLHRTGLAHQDKVQTTRQIGQVTATVTYNREEGRRDGWQPEGEATRKMEDRGTRGRGAQRGRPAANDRGWRRWWIEGTEGRGHGEWRRAGWLRSVSVPRDWGHVIGHTWSWSPRQPSQKFTAFTEFVWRWRSRGDGWGASRACRPFSFV